MTYCHVSAQCDAHARQLSAEQAMDEASDLYMDEIRKDYGPRLDELAAALADYISEDDLNGCLAVYRMNNPRPPQPPAPKIDPKHSHRQGDWGCGMSKNKSDELAFPYAGVYGDFPGMDLRDYFAAKAMKGFMATGEEGSLHPETVARTAYAHADAMLAARQEGQS